MTQRVDDMSEYGQGRCVALFVAETQGYFQNIRYLNMFETHRADNVNLFPILCFRTYISFLSKIQITKKATRKYLKKYLAQTYATILHLSKVVKQVEAGNTNQVRE